MGPLAKRLTLTYTAPLSLAAACHAIGTPCLETAQAPGSGPPVVSTAPLQ
jgi:hypothetical protein